MWDHIFEEGIFENTVLEVIEDEGTDNFDLIGILVLFLRTRREQKFPVN
jgi:hypothetical protein